MGIVGAVHSGESFADLSTWGKIGVLKSVARFAGRG
jgi:hypothetical protein